MNAEILTVGAELLAGDILDTNFRDLARALKSLGIAVTRHLTVPDEEEAIAAALRQSLAAADLVLVTGGLGPTPDDRTRAGIARGLEVDCVLYPELRPALEARYRSYGHRAMPEINLTQITLPAGAVPLPNPMGTAPGFRVEREGKALFAVPGIPREMHAILEDSILPWLREHRPVRALLTRTLKTQGIGESELVTRFGPLFDGLKDVELAFYPQQPGVNLKLTAAAGDPVTAERRLAEAARELAEGLGAAVYGVDGETLAEVAGRLLIERGWRIAVAESCTGGALVSYLLSVPGASRYVDRGVVVYSDRAKTELLGVPEGLIRSHGAVSEEVARAMAEGLRERSGVEVVMATTGIAGPGGGTEDKPVGLVHSAVATPAGLVTYRSRHPGTRDMVVRRAVRTDVNRLRLALLKA